MNEKEATELLTKCVKNGLFIGQFCYNPKWPEDKSIVLDDSYDIEELEALIYLMKNHPESDFFFC